MLFELHCHTTCSDGSDTPEALSARVAAASIAVFAITDHDTCTHALGLPSHTRVVRGVELTVDDDGATIHMLAYDRGGDWDLLERELAVMQDARRARLVAMAARLEALGIPVDLGALSRERRAVGRPDLARLIVAHRHASSMKEAFARYLYDGGPVDIPHHRWPIAEALAAGRAAGAAMSLAHPHFYEQRAAALVGRYRDAGLTGLEAFYGGYDLARRRRWIEVADQLGVTCTGGSDWHGTDRTDLATGVGVEIPARRSDALLRWLAVA